MSGSIPAERIQAFCEVVRRYWPASEPTENPYGRYRYDRSKSWEPCGISVHWDSDPVRAANVHRGRATVVVPGGAFDVLDGPVVFEFLREVIERCHLVATRFDLCFDDYARVIDPHQIAVECERGNFTRFKRWEHRSPRDRAGTREADMVTFGRRGKAGGGAYLRVYDKALETDGEQDCIRWEVEFSKERAASVLFALAFGCVDVKAFESRVGGMIAGTIDFLDREARPGEKNLDRFDRVEWWQRIVERLGRVRLRMARKARTLQKSREWFEQSLAPLVAVFFESDGPGAFEAFMADLIQAGRSRFQPSHRTMLREYRENSRTRGRPVALAF